jgi:predicted Zn-dependent protease with MMP-like domain
LDQLEFESIVSASINELPPRLLAALNNLAISVEDMPSIADLTAAGLPSEQEIYGLYVGIPLTNRTTNYTMVVPDRIKIYKVPLERDFPDHAILKAQIRKTVLHELGHLYGMDEGDLKDQGYS